jgi:hypothetical protein
LIAKLVILVNIRVVQSVLTHPCANNPIRVCSVENLAPDAVALIRRFDAVFDADNDSFGGVNYRVSNVKPE